jgi:hypothetical protein
MIKRLIIILALCCAGFAQTRTFPAQETNNTFTGTNTFNGAVTLTSGTATLTSLSVTAGSTFAGSAEFDSFMKLLEIAAPSCAATFDFVWADSTAHRLKECDNNGSPVQIVHAGVDINTSDQVTVTHLATPLPRTQGGTDVNSTATFPTSGTINTGTGTTNKLPKFTTGASGVIGDSSITDNGTTVSTGEQIQSTLATGTAPLVVASTTPVANLSLSGGAGTAVATDTYSRTGVSNSRVFVTTDFTTANNANLQAITGLSWTFPATAANYSFHCGLSYSQATANVGVNFGIQAVTNNPTNIFAQGIQELTLGPPSTFVSSTLATLATTTATAIMGSTPGALGTNYSVTIDGTIELGASANTVNIMVQTANGADAVTVKRGSYCYLF